MTISEKDQKENLELAFRLMMVQLADSPILQTFFNPSADPFTGVLQTTWKELCQQGWLKELQLYGQLRYRLTGSGWLEGLYRTRAGEDRMFLDRLGQLSATLKAHVKGRRADVTVEFSTLVKEAGLPEGWVSNVLESSAFEKLQRRRGPSWDERGILVRIPLNLGMQLLDHTADIRAELEILREELDSTKEVLKEYTCAFCGAPIDGQGCVPLSESVDGYYVSYACGRYETDGCGSRPCPSDPKFPKLEDYVLTFTEHPQESRLKWSCQASPKTLYARQVSLSLGLGETKEEARQRVVEEYQRLAKPW